MLDVVLFEGLYIEIQKIIFAVVELYVNHNTVSIDGVCAA